MIEIGQDVPPQEGSYTIGEKMVERAHYSRNGQEEIPPGDPRNPYGRFWLGLGGGIGVHGKAAGGYTPNGPRGSINVSDRDAQDLYAILSVGSRIEIKRTVQGAGQVRNASATRPVGRTR